LKEFVVILSNTPVVILSLPKDDSKPISLGVRTNQDFGHPEPLEVCSKHLSSMLDLYNYWVYILRCVDGKYYTGVTNDLDRRLLEHNEGANPKCFTFERRPVELVYEEHLNDIKEAIAREKQLKGWTRKKKEALIRQDFEELKKLSKPKSNSLPGDSTPIHPSTGSG
jgi:putative endonuclease